MVRRSSFVDSKRRQYEVSGSMTTYAQRLVSLRRSASDFSGTQIAVLFVILMLVTTIPVWTHPLPPLSDYVNHLARMHVISVVANDPMLAQFYQIEWLMIPNLAMDLIVPLLSKFMTVYRAGQVFTVLIFVLLMSGTLALNRALFGRWSVSPLAAFPLLYNHVFLVGTMNYLFGVGIALWAMAAWVALRERPYWLRAPVSALFVGALFFCHLFDVGIYGIGLLAFELTRLIERRRWPRWRETADFCAAGLPFLPIVPLLLRSPTFGLARENYWEPLGKLDGLIYAIQVYSDVVTVALLAIAVVALIWAVRHGVMRFHPLGWALLAVGGLTYLVMPRVLFATYLADQRLPIALAFMLVGCLYLETRHRMVRRGFIAMLFVLLALRVIEVDASWAELSRGTLEFRDSVRRITRGSKILVAYADRAAGDEVRDLGLVHAACVAMIERSSMVTTAFTVVGKQVLRVKPEFRDRVDTEDGTPPSLPQLLLDLDRGTDEPEHYWENWQDRYDYLYVLFTDDEAENPAPEQLTLVFTGARFQLYRIRKPT
jgi:hypothetical protein